MTLTMTLLKQLMALLESINDFVLYAISPFSNFLYSASEAASEGGGESHSNMAPLFFIIVALLIGTSIRHWLKKFFLPFTITLLIVGFLIGLANRNGLFSSFWGLSHDSGLNIFSDSINWAGHIEPHLILFIFLPTLIFEAAYALHIHTFKKSLVNSLILAIPGIIVALAITAGFIMVIKGLGWGLNQWTWLLALLFGAIISATDPVAVVAILKEVGASKKLSTITESESMLNDGTAIVFFLTFFALIVGDDSGGNAFVEFFRISLGGMFVGGIVGWLVITWIKRVFNDAMIEITVIIIAAYLAFILAESIFHVSGVISVLTFGVVMAGPGRTRVSPGVTHFLHEFWELAAFIANTLIFVIVGIVIAMQVKFTFNDLIAVLIVYVGIHVARFACIYVFFPLMRKIGYGLTFKDSIVLWWGGLRGAVGLALTLIVASEGKIDPEVRSQMLTLTAGIVVLTSLINATTVKWLIDKLGLSKVGEARIQMLNQTLSVLRQSSEKEITKLQENRFMSGADWDAVAEFLPELNYVKSRTKGEEKLFETRKLLLQKEKESYWRQFSEGLLAEKAVRSLSDEIDHLMDYNGEISLGNRKDLENLWKTPKIAGKLQTIPILGRFWKQQFYNKLAFSYDCARGFAVANEENLKSLSSIIVGLTETENVEKEVEKISNLEDEINENKIMGLTFIRNLKETYPEICNAIETQIASRSLLNHQMINIQKMEKQGRLEPSDAANLEAEVQSRMKSIIDSPLKYQVTSSLHYLQAIPHLKALNLNDLIFLSKLLSEKVTPIEGKITTEGDESNGFHIIIRGTARLEQEGKLKMMLEPGNVIGAYDTLARVPFWSTVTAESPVTSLKLSSSDISKKLNDKKNILNKLWYFAGIDLAERLLAKAEPWSKWRAKKLKNYVVNGEVVTINPGEKHRFEAEAIILLVGEVVPEGDEEKLLAPCLVKHNEIMVKAQSILFVFHKNLVQKEA